MLSRANMRGARRADSGDRFSPSHIRLDMTDITPRVNGARMSDYIGRPVRLICKVTKVCAFSKPANPTSLFVAD